MTRNTFYQSFMRIADLRESLLFGGSSSNAATIIKLNLGGVGPDVAMPAGVLGTMSDGIAVTTGDQNTDVEFTGFLDGPFPDITTTDASFSLSGLAPVGAPSVFGSLVIQSFSGGTFTLYNNDVLNTVLLTGPMTTSALTGVIGPPGTGALFTTTLGTGNRRHSRSASVPRHRFTFDELDERQRRIGFWGWRTSASSPAVRGGFLGEHLRGPDSRTRYAGLGTFGIGCALLRPHDGVVARSDPAYRSSGRARRAPYLRVRLSWRL